MGNRLAIERKNWDFSNPETLNELDKFLPLDQGVRVHFTFWGSREVYLPNGDYYLARDLRFALNGFIGKVAEWNLQERKQAIDLACRLIDVLLVDKDQIHKLEERNIFIRIFYRLFAFSQMGISRTYAEELYNFYAGSFSCFSVENYENVFETGRAFIKEDPRVAIISKQWKDRPGGIPDTAHISLIPQEVLAAARCAQIGQRALERRASI